MDFLDRATVVKLLEGSNRCLLGVSGGVDSMVLLHWFAKEINRGSFRGINFEVMHVDHGINAASGDWANQVKSVSERLGFKCTVANVSLDGLGNNLEYAARQARYKAFCETGVDTVILAHHANDQCESFLLKLFRGSGVKGLKTMGEKTPCWLDPSVTIIRPMLNITRPHIELWAQEHNVTAVDDPSNFDTKYDRNYIRHEIWPVIQNRFDIADINTVRSIQHLSEAWELTNVLADQDIEHCTVSDNVLDWEKMKSIGYLRIKNLILRLLDRDGAYGFSVNHIEQFTKGLLEADVNSKNEMNIKSMTMKKVGKKIYVQSKVQVAA